MIFVRCGKESYHVAGQAAAKRAQPCIPLNFKSKHLGCRLIVGVCNKYCPGKKSSPGHHRCVTPLYHIPMWSFNYVVGMYPKYHTLQGGWPHRPVAKYLTKAWPVGTPDHGGEKSMLVS